MDRCQHLTDDACCGVATQLAGVPAPANPVACELCTTRSALPRQINRHTVSLANRVKPGIAGEYRTIISRDYDVVDSLFVYYPEGWKNVTDPSCTCTVKEIPEYPYHAFAGTCDCKAIIHKGKSETAEFETKESKVSCPKSIKGSCTIAATVALQDVKPTDLHCAACVNGKHPKTFNGPTVSLALSVLPKEKHAETCRNWTNALNKMITITPFLPCKHRGDVIERFACACAGKKNGVPLYACRVHEFCAMDAGDKERIWEAIAQKGLKLTETPHAGAHVCAGCPNRVE